MDWPGRRVLVTGASGFIGTRLAARLIELGADVARLPGRAAAANLSELVRDARPGIIFHLAAETSVEAPPVSHRACNVELTRELLRAAAAVPGLGAFVHVGTCGEYGDAPLPLREDGPCLPPDVYGQTKLEATQGALDAAVQGLPVVVARPFLTFGPGQRAPRLMPLLASAVAHGLPLDLTPGEQTRDVIYVDDVVEALLALGGNPAARGFVVNVGSGIPRRVRDLAEAMREAGGVPAERSPLRFGARSCRPGEPMAYFADVTRQRRLVGFTERTPLAEALARTVAWHRGEPPLPSPGASKV